MWTHSFRYLNVFTGRILLVSKTKCLISVPVQAERVDTKILSLHKRTMHGQSSNLYRHPDVNINKSAKLTVARLMVPDDANMNGNVHGGTILKLIEEAGAIAAAKYCNNEHENETSAYIPAIPTLARIEKKNFLGPMFIGEVAELYTHVSYTSNHSLQVTVHVYAENVFKGSETGSKRLTNKAVLWYVPVNKDNVNQVLRVPKLKLSSQEEAMGEASYNQQRKQRTCTLLHLADTNIGDPEPFTVGFSRTVISTLIGPSDVFSHGYCKGGVIMKLMDECAGITAGKHTKTAVVTVSMDATNFLAKTKIGAVLSLHGILTYTGEKSMEIQVVVDSEHIFNQSIKKQRAVEAFFTFVSLDHRGKPLPVPPVKIKTAQERARYGAGEQRYKQRLLERKMNT